MMPVYCLAGGALASPTPEVRIVERRPGSISWLRRFEKLMPRPAPSTNPPRRGLRDRIAVSPFGSSGDLRKASDGHWTPNSTGAAECRRIDRKHRNHPLRNTITETPQ